MPINTYSRRACLLVAGLILGLPTAAAQVDGFMANYRSFARDREVGTTTFTLSAAPSGPGYIFESSTAIRGILRLAAPNPVIDRSEFVLDGQTPVPQRFEYQDGTRKGDDNFVVEFDWAASAARRSGKVNDSIPLEPGVVDRGTAQAMLILQLRRGTTPETLLIIDDDGIDPYRYQAEGTFMVETDLGPQEVVRYTQQRAGSSRRLEMDFATSLGYVPVRIEQFSGDESRSRFVIEALAVP